MEWRNSGIAEWTLLLICTSWKFMPCKGTCMEIYALQGHVHGNLCLARARAWKFMPCKGTCMEIYALQGHVHGNLCLARERAWKFMPCKGVATIEATTSVKVSALALS